VKALRNIGIISISVGILVIIGTMIFMEDWLGNWDALGPFFISGFFIAIGVICLIVFFIRYIVLGKKKP